METATEYFERIYGLDGNGLELNHYYDAEAAVTVAGGAAYCVNWSDVVNGQYYYFWVSVEDGTILRIDHSSARLQEQLDAVKPTIEEAPDRIAQMKEQAERFLTDKMELQETYERVRSCYQTTSEGDISRLVDILFVRADGTACLVGCGWDGSVNGYGVTTEEAYEEKMALTQEVMTKRYTEEYGREVAVENIWN